MNRCTDIYNIRLAVSCTDIYNIRLAVSCTDIYNLRLVIVLSLWHIIPSHYLLFHNNCITFMVITIKSYLIIPSPRGKEYLGQVWECPAVSPSQVCLLCTQCSLVKSHRKWNTSRTCWLRVVLVTLRRNLILTFTSDVSTGEPTDPDLPSSQSRYGTEYKLVKPSSTKNENKRRRNWRNVLEVTLSNVIHFQSAKDSDHCLRSVSLSPLQISPAW